MSNYENIEYIIKKRQDNINNKKMWFDGLTDEEYKIYNRYYIKKLREKYSIETDQRKTWDAWYKEFAPKTQDVNEYIKFYKTDKKHSILIFKSHYLNYCYLRKVLLTVYLNGLGLSQIN